MANTSAQSVEDSKPHWYTSGSSSISATNMIITGGNFHFIMPPNRDPRQVIKENFHGYISLDVTHDSNNLIRPRRHPSTAASILQELTEWALKSDDSFPVFWLHGPSGVGKTAMAISLAKILSKQGRLAASFFFRRDDERELGKTLIPSIAYQISLAIPELRPRIAEIVESNPMIFGHSLETQMAQLIIGPALSTNFSFPRIIIIDGLDECAEENLQWRILVLINNASPLLAGKLKFFISSRPENGISKGFDEPALKLIAKSRTLNDPGQRVSFLTLRVHTSVVLFFFPI